MATKSFPSLSLVCLQSAEQIEASDLVDGRDTIIGK